MMGLNCFDCKWISAFCNESEMLFIGGLALFTFNTILLTTGTTYVEYIKGLMHISYGLSHGPLPISRVQSQKPRNNREQQIAFRLLSHQLFQHLPYHELAQKFERCPDYISRILHLHCGNMTLCILFSSKNPVFDRFFKEDGYVRFDILNTIYPNL
eukprot:267993_1